MACGHLNLAYKGKEMELIKMPRTEWKIEARDAQGNLLWEEEIKNLVTNAGIDFALDKLFKGVNYTAAWFVGLVNEPATFAPEDTSALHPGWTENTLYDEPARPTLTLGTVANRSVDNAANRAVFTMNATAVISGVFLCTTNGVAGGAGTIYSEAAFANGPRNLSSGAILSVTVVATGA